MYRREFLSGSFCLLGGCLSGTRSSHNAENLDLSKLQWERSDENPLIKGIPETNNQAGFGGIMYGREVFTNPIDDWYFYWAGHDGGGIWLSTAPSIRGPWKVHAKLFDVRDIGAGNHVSSPYPLPDPENGMLRLYYHRGYEQTNCYRQNSELLWLDSEMGVKIKRKYGTVLSVDCSDSWEGNERSYFNVLRHNGKYYGVYQGRDFENTTPGIGYGTSEDGLHWNTSSTPAFYNSHVQQESNDAFVGTPHILKINAKMYIFYQDRARISSPNGIYALPWDKRNEKVNDGKLILMSDQEWTDNQSLHVVDSIIRNQKLFIFYSNSTAGRTQDIGLAVANI